MAKCLLELRTGTASYTADHHGETEMHNIMILNAKGGCGKTTISTTLACYFAGQGYATALLDYDPQNSSRRWLTLRAAESAEISSIDAARPQAGVTRSWQLHTGNETDIVVTDTPAGIAGGKLFDLYQRADSILIPVMPSIIDFQAIEGFLKDLMRPARHRRGSKRIAIVANRVKFRTDAYRSLVELAKTYDIPVIGSLRDTQNYSIAMESGLGVCELTSSSSEKDRKQWQPIIRWLQESIPEKMPQKKSAPAVKPVSWNPQLNSLVAS